MAQGYRFKPLSNLERLQYWPFVRQYEIFKVGIARQTMAIGWKALCGPASGRCQMKCRTRSGHAANHICLAAPWTSSPFSSSIRTSDDCVKPRGSRGKSNAFVYSSPSSSVSLEVYTLVQSCLVCLPFQACIFMTKELPVNALSSSILVRIIYFFATDYLRICYLPNN